MREPEFNVATWNLTQRRATGKAPYDIMVNDRPLVFYHFSGFDSGAQRAMLDRYGSHSPVLYDLRDWYIARCEELGQSRLGGIDCIYNSFRNGRRIKDVHRLVYRRREDLMECFADPFDTSDPRRSYLRWFELHGPAERLRPLVKLLKQRSPWPALRLARSARNAWRRWSRPA